MVSIVIPRAVAESSHTLVVIPRAVAESSHTLVVIPRAVAESTSLLDAATSFAALITRSMTILPVQHDGMVLIDGDLSRPSLNLDKWQAIDAG
jgi:hypothetical protein